MLETARSDELKKKHVEDMLYVATQLEDTFLKDKPFLCGDEISIADLMAISEVRSHPGTNGDG